MKRLFYFYPSVISKFHKNKTLFYTFRAAHGYSMGIYLTNEWWNNNRVEGPLMISSPIPFFFFSFLSWWDWALSAGLHTCIADTVCLSHTFSPFCSRYFEDRVSQFPQAGFDPPDLSIPNSYDYRCEPPVPRFQSLSLLFILSPKSKKWNLSLLPYQESNRLLGFFWPGT
jgi:hypothetical protein